MVFKHCVFISSEKSDCGLHLPIFSAENAQKMPKRNFSTCNILHSISVLTVESQFYNDILSHMESILLVQGTGYIWYRDAAYIWESRFGEEALKSERISSKSWSCLLPFLAVPPIENADGCWNTGNRFKRESGSFLCFTEYITGNWESSELCE